jgi:hypothetical protein
MAQVTSAPAMALAMALAVALFAAAPARAQDAAAADALDAQARARMGMGDARGALQLMREHVAAQPGDRDARLDLVRYLTWNGDYAAARAVLLADPALADSAEGREQHASLLAWAGRIDEAQAINAPLLDADPAGMMPNYTQAVALRQSARPALALPHVAAVEQARPGSKDAIDLARATRVRTRSAVTAEYVRSDDSDDLVSSRPTLRGEFVVTDALRVTAEAGRWRHSAPAGSPFLAVDGARAIDQDRALVGLRYAPSPRTELAVAAGHSSIDGDSTQLWRAAADYRASDSIRLGLSVDHDWHAVSPRALSLGIDRTTTAGQLHWTPDLRWTGDLGVRHEDYADGNESIEWTAAVRRAVLRNPGLMLDLGAMVQHLSHDQNLGNGYYAPDRYRRYGLTAHAYFGLGDDVGLSLQGGLGRQRDETFSSWRRANDLSAALVFGIYSPWQFLIHAGYSERVQMSGAYEGYSWGMALTRRF